MEQFIDWVVNKFKNEPISPMLFILGGFTLILGITGGFNVPIVGSLTSVGIYQTIALILGNIFILAAIYIYLKYNLPREKDKKFERYILVYKDAESDWEALFDLAVVSGDPCGINIEDAKKSKKVTIIGADTGIKKFEEQQIKNANCEIERLDGYDKEDTKELIRRRVKNNRGEFTGQTERLNYPN